MIQFLKACLLIKWMVFTVTFLFTIILCILLCLSSISDIRNRTIPNVIVVMILVFGIFYSFLHHSLYNALLGVIIPSIPLLVAKYKFNFFIGAGDIKLLSAIGAWLSWFLNLYVLLLSCVIVLIFVLIMRLLFRTRVLSVPFAPFLSIASLIIYIVSVNSI
ncbi:prepilin peptidase [Paenibacillus sp. D2_2]|uniref:prepilin peptidase n=1 Tax=Paenibacillus sp. D2_2 TaxID=3073092 RepID=UPI0035C1C90B